jgi:hypothetical protein
MLLPQMLFCLPKSYASTPSYLEEIAEKEIE